MAAASTTTILRRRLAIAATLLLLLLFAALWKCAESPPPTETSFDYIGEKAKALAFDPDRIIAFAQQDLRAESYQGALRGAVGALWAGAGNDLDRALLLKALLDRTKAQSRLTHGSAWGVEISDGGGYRYVGPALPADPGASPAIPSDADYHVIAVIHHATVDHKDVAEPAGQYRVADLIADDLRVLYRAEGGKTVAVIGTAGRAVATATDVLTATREELEFRISGPGAETAVVHRELATSEDQGFPCLFHPENRYAVVVTAGWVPESVLAKETDRAATWRDKADAVNHAIAYRFLALSDRFAQQAASEHQVAARFVSPRLTIAAGEVALEAGKPRRHASIDLRKDDIRAEGAGAVAFQWARAQYDAAVETSVLESVTGEGAFSAADVLASAADDRPTFLADRQALLSGSLVRLIKEARAGAALQASPVGQPEIAVRFERQADGSIVASLPDAVKQALAAAGGDDLGLLRTPKFGPGDIERVARETEVALAVAGKRPRRYELDLAYSEAPARAWYRDARVFVYEDKRLNFEQQFPQLEPDLSIDFVEYFDWDKMQYLDAPRRGNVRVNHDDLENAHVFSTWYGNTQGRTVDLISRAAYRELLRDGSTVLRWRYRNDQDSEPMRFWLVSRGPWNYVINNRRVALPVLHITGDYVSRRPAKPEKWSDIPAIDEGDYIHGLNSWTVLDDPDFPLLYHSPSVQTAIPGRILDAKTKRGVAQAKIALPEVGAAALTWPDGRFALPIIKEEFREFQVTVAAPGYAPLALTRDFRDADAFPIELALEPLPPPQEGGFVWITAATLDQALGPLALAPRSKRLIAEAIHANAKLMVGVPRTPTRYAYGPIDAWLEVDAASGAGYPRLVDGLYGSTDRWYTPDHTTSNPTTLGDYAKDVGDWARDKAADTAGDKIKGLGGQAISYYDGRIAAWYLFAAGALDSVSLAMSDPNVTLADMHKNAIARAREMAKVYELGGSLGDKAFNAGIDQIGGDYGSFLAGLKDGLDWSDQYYRKAWGL